MANRTTLIITLVSLLALQTTACDRPEPNVTVKDWNLSGDPGSYNLRVELLPVVLADNGMGGKLKLLFADGCSETRNVNFMKYKPGSEFVPAPGSGQTFVAEQPVHAESAVASAELQLDHWTGTDRGAQRFYDGKKVIDSQAQRKAEKMKCKATALDNVAPSESSRETAATLINLRGYLCGRVTDIYPRGSGMLVVHCTEYRDGRGKAQYLVRTDSASVERLD